MILADKIINERKKNGWSQEELAEQLSVSRQSVSKWEGAQAVPDLQKIIMMADIFGVSTDYLLKDEIEEKKVDSSIVEESTSTKEAIKVTLEEANEFIQLTKQNSPKIALGVSLCILSPVVLLILAGLTELEGSGVSDFVASLVGVVTLLGMVAAAVYIFIVYGTKLKKYEYMDLEDIETAYGVAGMVEEKKKDYESIHTNATALGVIMCILSSVPLIASAFFASDWVVVCMVALLLTIIAIAVNIFVRVNSIWDCYNKLLEFGDYSYEKKQLRKVKSRVAGIYWIVALGIYLAWSFLTTSWEYTWVVWPIAAVLYAGICSVIDAVVKVDRR